jgi:hypothetical protein
LVLRKTRLFSPQKSAKITKIRDNIDPRIPGLLPPETSIRKETLAEVADDGARS